MTEIRRNRVTVVMGNALKNRLQDLADKAERSLSDFVRLICKDYLEALDAEDVIKEED